MFGYAKIQNSFLSDAVVVYDSLPCDGPDWLSRLRNINTWQLLILRCKLQVVHDICRKVNYRNVRITVAWLECFKPQVINISEQIFMYENIWTQGAFPKNNPLKGIVFEAITMQRD